MMGFTPAPKRGIRPALYPIARDYATLRRNDDQGLVGNVALLSAPDSPAAGWAPWPAFFIALGPE
jgi:hypothetical protein